ncbi:MAG: hypothetical protein HHJ13_00090 [Phycicoccus sp.]|nr:hypothetical protein [Phycicoccus sp.]
MSRFRKCAGSPHRGYPSSSGNAAAAWNLAEGPTVTRADVDAAGSVDGAELDESFCRACIRTAPEKLHYLRHDAPGRRRAQGKRRRTA